MVQLKFSEPFQDRLQERAIEVDHIRKTINAPDVTHRTHHGRIIARKKIDDLRMLEVIYYKESFRSNTYLIITAYYVTP